MSMTNSDLSHASLDKERERVNRCLRKERERVDQQVTKERAKSEHKIAKKLGEIRKEEDERVETVRTKLDDKSQQTASKVTEKVENESNAVQPAVEEMKNVEVAAIQKERQILDTSRERERATADGSIQKEREEEARRQRSIFDKERRATDRSLAVERRRSDELFHKIEHLLDQRHQKVHSLHDFLGMVSHDLRNYVEAIHLAAEALEDQLAATPNTHDYAERFVDVIKRTSRTMVTTINELMEFQYIDSGEFKLKKEHCDLSKLASQAVELEVQLAKKKDIQIELNLPPAPTECPCDPHRIERVLCNLLSNAIKHTPEHGKIDVHVVDEDKEAKVCIEDTGKGVPQGDRERIFQRFVQVNDSNKQGLGLGLYIARRIMEAHGGSVWHQPRSEGGSAFIFTLPKVPEGGSNAPTP
jgi:signal transduction histidine kinase